MILVRMFRHVYLTIVPWHNMAMSHGQTGLTGMTGGHAHAPTGAVTGFSNGFQSNAFGA